jgi:hypothetical protein
MHIPKKINAEAQRSPGERWRNVLSVFRYKEITAEAVEENKK